MNNEKIKKIVEDLIGTFLYAGQVALDLRDKGLKKKMKSDLEKMGFSRIALEIIFF